MRPALENFPFPLKRLNMCAQSSNPHSSWDLPALRRPKSKGALTVLPGTWKPTTKAVGQQWGKNPNGRLSAMQVSRTYAKSKSHDSYLTAPENIPNGHPLAIQVT